MLLVHVIYVKQVNVVIACHHKISIILTEMWQDWVEFWNKSEYIFFVVIIMWRSVDISQNSFFFCVAIFN